MLTKKHFSIFFNTVGTGLEDTKVSDIVIIITLKNLYFLRIKSVFMRTTESFFSLRENRTVLKQH